MSAPTNAPERADADQFKPGFGKGGVPWFLLLVYLSFLCFFTWYVLEYQLEDFLAKQAVVEEPED